MAFQLRTLGEVDCATNPSDPVCSAFYGNTTPTNVLPMYSASYMQTALIQAAQQKAAQAGTTYNAGANVVPAPGSTLPTVTALANGSWWNSLPWYAKLGILGLGAFVGWKGYQHFSKKA